VLAGTVAIAGVLFWAVRDLPVTDVLPPLEQPRLELVTEDGEQLYSRGAYRANYVALDALPPVLIEAVLAVEDRRFFDHGGVDLRGIARAAVANLRSGGIVQGGSSITQQLVKVLYLSPERIVRRKLQEMLLAVTLEHNLGKERILELYLNSVYFGAGAWGAPAAAEVYFGKDAAELSLAEAAILAAAIKAPSRINLLADPDQARNRAETVLALMQAQGRTSPEARVEARTALATISATPPPTRAGSYYVDWVLGEAQALSDAVEGQITVTASLDPELQAKVERIVSEIIAGKGRAAGATQAALVAMTPQGQVRAMVGGVDYAESQFNRATDALRQPGSTFKLPVFLTALAAGATPDTVVSDAPIEIDGWKPQNYDGNFNGNVTLREAFSRSLNVATVRLAQQIGIANVISTARQLGIEGTLNEGASLALGASEVTLLDMTEAYAAILAGRMPVEATGVQAIALGDGETVLARPAGGLDAVELEKSRAPMLEMLREVVTSGTGREAQLPGFAAGKTGTSQEHRDAWFIGFDDRLVVGVWVGNDDATPMDDVTGGNLPVQIWRAVMLAASGGREGGTPPPAEALAADLETQQAVQCNVRACSQAYRSFRAAGCTFQPYRGGRKICTR
jgi:1A family penicillin-binding protein